MKKICFSQSLVVPQAWASLLALGNFETLAQYPAKARDCLAQPQHVVDATPYCDDARQVSVQEGEYLLILYLLSGTSNYWLGYEVWRDDEILYDGMYNAFYEVPDGNRELPITDELVISFRVTSSAAQQRLPSMVWRRFEDGPPTELGQVKVFFYSTGWACPVYGLYTRCEGVSEWAEYDQQNDRFYAADFLDGKDPEFYAVVTVPGETAWPEDV